MADFYKKIGLSLCLLLLINLSVFAQPQAVENLDRGLVAVKKGTSGIYLSWRLLLSDPNTVEFNVYRGETKINDAPISTSTNFLDAAGTVDDSYKIAAVVDGVEQEASEPIKPWSTNYLDVPLQRPAGGTTQSGSFTYSANDASVADLDGDGEWEIVLKWDPSNSQDNSNSGHTGNVILDGYELDGTLMWRIDLGVNIRAGAHYTQFMVYDLDGDGMAEVACKTADGTVDADGTVIGDGTKDYRNSSGYILTGPEFFTIFEGTTGKALKTVDYIPPRHPDTLTPTPSQIKAIWGDDYGNRVDRFLACVAYLDGERPSVVMQRGYYTRTVLAAWDWRDGELTSRWVFDTNNSGYSTWAGQGNHNLSVGDCDFDGKDEIFIGSIAIDDDGTGLWNSRLGHGDAMHLSDIDPWRPGLELWSLHGEDSSTEHGSALHDARTGEVLWGTPRADVGRGVSANVNDSEYGMECWGGTDGLRSCKNVRVGGAPSSANHVIWWDGDLARELLDAPDYVPIISKYNGSNLLLASGTASNNSTKRNPCLQADIFGDWREELVARTSSSSALRIYTTDIPTEYRIVTLMQDRHYRLAIAWQNVAYNQPPHTSFYIGTGMFVPDSLRPPAKPVNLAAYAGQDTVALVWEPNVDLDLVGYNIYRAETAEGPFTKLNNTVVTDTTYIDRTIVNEVTYYYVITALDEDGNESEYSSNASGTPTRIPKNPTNLFFSVDLDSALLFWQPNDEKDIVGYNIYRSETSGESYVKVNTEVVTDTSFIDKGLTTGQTYYYVITAQDNEDIESEFSGEITTIPDKAIVYQAEEAELSGGCQAKTFYPDHHGRGYVDFPERDGICLFNNINGRQGGSHLLIFRYTLYPEDVLGILSVNGKRQLLRLSNTGSIRNWESDTLEITLEPGFTNFIHFRSYGNDFGMLDEVTIVPQFKVDVESSDELAGSIPKDYQLQQNYPNPFNGTTQIEYSLKEKCNVTIKVFNYLGQHVATLVNETREAKKYTVRWNGRNDAGLPVTSGLYFYKISTSTGFKQVQKMLYLK